MEVKNKKLIGQLCLFLTVFAIAFFGTRYLIPKINPNSELEKTVAEMNKKGPVMVDAETRLENSSVSGDTLQYNYTLIHITEGDPGFDKKKAEQFLKQNAQQNLDNSPEMAFCREKKIALKYLYKDKDRKVLFNFTITAK